MSNIMLVIKKLIRFIIRIQAKQPRLLKEKLILLLDSNTMQMHTLLLCELGINNYETTATCLTENHQNTNPLQNLTEFPFYYRT